MPQNRGFIVAALSTLSLALPAFGADTARGLATEAKPDSPRDVRPILSENCFHCHGPDGKARKRKFRPDLPDTSTMGGGPGVVVRRVVVGPGRVATVSRGVGRIARGYVVRRL